MAHGSLLCEGSEDTCAQSVAKFLARESEDLGRDGTQTDESGEQTGDGLNHAEGRCHG
jgi:hypothetical protein